MNTWKHRGMALLIGISLFFVIGEITYRSYVYFFKPLHRPSRVKGVIWEPTPGAEVHWEGMDYKISSMGLKDYEYTVKKPDSVFRIAMVGDSVTFGETELPDTYPNVMEKKLRERFKDSRMKFEVLNFGINGTGSQHHLNLVKERVLQYEPDLIILGYCLNDIRFTFIYNNPQLVWILQHSHFANFIAVRSITFYKILREKMGIVTVDNYFEYVLKWYDDPARLARLRGILREMNHTANKRGIKFVVAVFPFSQQLKEGADLKPQRVVADICKTEGISVHDTLADIKVYKADDLYFKGDNVHFSAFGNKALAESILKFLEFKGAF